MGTTRTEIGGEVEREGVPTKFRQTETEQMWNKPMRPSVRNNQGQIKIHGIWQEFVLRPHFFRPLRNNLGFN